MTTKTLSAFSLSLAALCVIAFSLLPALWQLLTSVTPAEDLMNKNDILPVHGLTLAHYKALFSRQPFLQYIMNSFFIATASTLLSLCCGVPAAYVLARKHLPLSSLVYLIIAAVTLFPYVFLFLGIFEAIHFLHAGNSRTVLVILYTAINLPMTIIVMTTFFSSIPRDIEDAALLDGYGPPGLLFTILLPLSAPALASTAILCFIFAWNEFVFALTFLSENMLKTIPVAASQLEGASTRSAYEVPYGVLSAATVVGTAPLVMLVLMFQKKIVQGLTAGAIKG